MAGVERAKRALWSLLRSFKVQGSAKLTVTTAKGKLKVIFEESFDVQSTPSRHPRGQVANIFSGRRRRLPTLLSNSQQLSIKLKLQLEKYWQALRRSEPTVPSSPS